MFALALMFVFVAYCMIVMTHLIVQVNEEKVMNLTKEIQRLEEENQSLRWVCLEESLRVFNTMPGSRFNIIFFIQQRGSKLD